MIAKFNANVPQSVEYAIDTDKNPVMIAYGGWLLSIDELTKIVETAQAALRFAEKVQTDLGYEEDYTAYQTPVRTERDEDLPF